MVGKAYDDDLYAYIVDGERIMGRDLEYDGMRVKVLRLMTWIDPRETAITWIR